jgi:uncharacterized protein YndB with AHSA1/START domain
MGTLPKHGRCEATTTASPDAVWTVLSDPSRIGEWSHETREGVWLDGATGARPGARFRAKNRAGRSRWQRVSEIAEVDAPHVFAWRTVPTAVYRDSTLWRVTLEPDDGGTRIVQTFDVLHISPVLDRLFYLLIKVHRDRSAALGSDIERLGAVAAADEARSSAAHDRRLP